LGDVRERLSTILGNVPNLIDLPAGCKFAARCPAREEYGLEICRQVEPDLISIDEGHTVRCWLYQDHDGHKAPLKKKVQGR
jgi:oligopeptide/dipeptide ABC transporter ATP-binding protein